jgi:surface antigen
MLAIVCALLGTLASTSVAMGQTGQAAGQQPALRATMAQATVPRQVATQRPQARPTQTPRTNTIRRRPIGPQDQAQAALLTPVAARAPLPGYGTPILPVAQTSGLSCVPFARMATGMTISGDARLWWHNAAGTYARGQAPERGAILAFMASGGMSRGHVGVVSRVVNPRTILLDHANWAGPGIRRGSVMRGVTVLDVSDRNDWTSVRVQVGHSAETFGRTYPTHGFIYNRPAGTRLLMASGTTTREVAEAPSAHAALHLRFAVDALAE